MSDAVAGKDGWGIDHLSVATRSVVMSRIRSVETGPERLLRETLGRYGLRGWRKNRRFIPNASSPDVAFTRWKVAVFVDGAFWHGHPKFFTPGKSGSYWDKKIARNRRRDRSTTLAYRAAGWRVLRVWDFAVEESPDDVARRVVDAVALRKTGSRTNAP
ncbi:MAG: very short patch repair endonuclease [Chloroflexi bacterium]|nr:very short patch repair endonuclease [Chloroflexota bacterium]